MWPEIVAASIAVAGSLYIFLKQRSAQKGDDDLNRRFRALEESREHLEREMRELVEKLHREELETVRINGDLKLSTNGQQKLERDVAEIKDKMVHRDEWERQMSELRQHLDGFVGRFDQLHDALVLKAAPHRAKKT